MRVNETNDCLKMEDKEGEKEKRLCIFFYLLPAIFFFYGQYTDRIYSTIPLQTLKAQLFHSPQK